MALSPGTRLGTFEIRGLLGEGGMSRVYRALDTKLDREVAIKVLPKAFAEDRARLARFEREAKLLAALDHPNIGALYEFQESDGVHFLVLQIVEGETLGERVALGPMPVKEAIPIFVQIAQGLEAAHEAGIVHRDLKPANIKIAPDDTVKILDFGIAKSTVGHRVPGAPTPTADTPPDPNAPTLPGTPTPPTNLTAEDMLVGTPSYMSPEQARGKQVDKRSDIFAFGCCLYEALAGRKTFPGETLADTISAITRDEPDWSRLPQNTPESLRNLLTRCLEKNPRRRLSSAGDIAITLEDAAESIKRDLQISRPESIEPAVAGTAIPVWAKVAGTIVALAVVAAIAYVLGQPDAVPGPTGTPELPPITSLAVLPFDNLMGDPEQEYFVDGMTDALSAELGKIKALKVISRSSAMRYKGTDKPLPQIARELGVEALVEGSVLRAGDEIRITAQLIHGATDSHLWAESYDGTFTNILALQKEVALAIAKAIQVAVTPEEETRITTAREVNPEAYEAYLRGTFFFWKLTPDSLEKAAESFQRAIELDSEFAEAHAWLGFAYWVPSVWGFVPAAEAVALARPAVAKALALDDTLADAHITAGWTALRFDWDWARSEGEFFRAIELNPGDPGGHHGLAWYYLSLGRFDDAIHKMQEAIDLDPLNLLFNNGLADVYGWAGRSEEAIAQRQKVLELEPAFLPALEGGSLDYILLSRYDAAIELIERGMASHGRLPLLLARLTWAHAGAGHKAETEVLLAELHSRDREEYVRATTFAVAYAALGDTNGAFRWIEQALEDRDFHVSQPYWPAWRLLRGDPRFLDMLRRINYPAIEEFKAVMQNAASPETTQNPID